MAKAKQYWLITAHAQYPGRLDFNPWMEATDKTPVQWLEDCQQWEDAVYFIINQHEITKAEYDRINGKLKGM